MNKLEYSISLRAKGLSKNEMIIDMQNNGFEDSEIDYYTKRSDEVYLNQLLSNKQTRKTQQYSRTFKSIVLLISFILLLFVFFDYARIGILGLFIFWSLVKFGSYKR